MNTKILEKLGKRLKQIRLDSNLTQEVLAEKLNIHPTYIGKLEGGKNNPSVLLMYKFARIFKLELKDLFDFK